VLIVVEFMIFGVIAMTLNYLFPNLKNSWSSNTESILDTISIIIFIVIAIVLLVFSFQFVYKMFQRWRGSEPIYQQDKE
jgi:heme/copper-type cytochrome/quinol oxidase subunit 2